MKQTVQPDATHASRTGDPKRSRPARQQTAAPGGRLAQLAAIMNGSPQVQRLAQLKDDIQRSPRVQHLMDLAAEINQGTPAQRAGVPVNDDAGLEHEADVMGAKAQALPRRLAADEAGSESAPTNGPAQFKIGTHGTLAQSDRAGDHDCNEVGAQSLKSRQSSPSAQSLGQASGGCSAQLIADPAGGPDEPPTVESPLQKKDAPETAFEPSSAVAQRAESAAPPPNHTGLPDQLKAGVESLSRGSPRQAVAQCMLGKNVVAKFKTKYGSVYTISEKGTHRLKFDKTVHEGSKNIFYASEDTSERLAKWAEKSSYTVTVDGTTAKFVFDVADEFGRNLVTAQTHPAVGLYPVDMLLTAEGKPDPEGDSFHYGDQITEVIP